MNIARPSVGVRSVLVGIVFAGSLVIGVGAIVLITLVATHPVAIIVSGSMVPILPLHSLVVFRDVPAASLHVGEIIGFTAPHPFPTVTVVHEVWHLTRVAGGWLVQTKGVANPTRDPWTLRIPAGADVQRAWITIKPDLLLVAVGVLALTALTTLLVGVFPTARRRSIAGRDLFDDPDLEAHEQGPSVVGGSTSDKDGTR